MSSVSSSVLGPYFLGGIVGAVLASSIFWLFRVQKQEAPANTRRDLLSSSLPTPKPPTAASNPEIDSDDDRDLDKYDFSYKMVSLLIDASFSFFIFH